MSFHNNSPFQPGIICGYKFRWVVKVGKETIEPDGPLPLRTTPFAPLTAGGESADRSSGVRTSVFQMRQKCILLFRRR